MTSPISKRYLLPLVLLTISLPAIATESLPTAQDINDAAQKAKQVSDSFFSQTFTIRMQYEYSGRFLNPQDKDTLCEAARQASADLEQIANTQAAMKKAIESYQKDDWETLFGQTGLWRNLDYGLCQTNSAKLQIQYYLAISTEPRQDIELLRNIARQTKSLCSIVGIVDPGLIKIRAIVALAMTDPNEKTAALREFDVFQIYSDMGRPALAEIERIKLLGEASPQKLDFIETFIGRNRAGRYLEPILSLMFLRHKYDPNGFEKDLRMFPETRPILGSLILSDISSQDSDTANLNNLTIIDADLAAYSALTNGLAAHKELLLALADIDQFKSPMVLYAAGLSVTDSAPQKAIKLLIEANTLQQKKKYWLIDIEADRTAEQAARLAYDSFTKKNVDCNLTLAAFDNYAHIASDKMGEEMRYLYGELLFDCGKTQEASEIFARLANSPNTLRQDKASLQLLKIKINTSQKDTLPQLRNFVLNCTGQDKFKLPLRLEAMDIYCRTAIAYDSNEYASQVIALLDTAEQTPGLQYDLFRAQALYQLGRLEEAAQYMAKAIIEDSNSSAALAAQIASEIIDKIELWQKDANDFNELLQNCDTLAEFAHKSANSRQTALLFAEVSTIQGKRGQESFSSTDENDVTWLRVQARLLMAQEKFEQSAKLWAKIAELRRNESPEQNNKSYGWWQAKFHELDCLAKSPSADKRNIAHIIDVLCGSNPQIPAPWAEKLDILKQHCAAN